MNVRVILAYLLDEVRTGLSARSLFRNKLRNIRVNAGMNHDSESPLVLHIEDDDGDAHLVVRSLALSSCDVRIARAVDGREAMNLIDCISDGTYEKPSLILLDLKLPFASGLEVLKKTRADRTLDDLPVVIFTSSDAEEDQIECKKAGCDQYLAKPIDYAAFRRTVEEVCTKYVQRKSMALPA